MRRMCLLVLSVVALSTGCDGGSPRFTDAGPERDAGADAGVEAQVGHPGSGIVTGAVKASSPNYMMYGTLRSGDGSSASPGYERRGGITGATQP